MSNSNIEFCSSNLKLTNEQQLLLYVLIDALNPNNKTDVAITLCRHVCNYIPEFVQLFNIEKPHEFRQFIIKNREVFTQELKLFLVADAKIANSIQKSYYVYTTCADKQITIHIQGKNNVDKVTGWIKDNKEEVLGIYSTQLPDKLLNDTAVCHVNRAVNPQLYREVLDPVMAS